MFTLVPASFFDESEAINVLSEVAELRETDSVRSIEIPQYDAVLIYSVDGDSVDSMPAIYDILQALPECPDYNKIMCAVQDGWLHLAIAQGKTLLLANCYPATDFTTAEYFIFLAMKSLQLNPEVSTIRWCSELSEEDETSLYRYFKSVEKK